MIVTKNVSFSCKIHYFELDIITCNVINMEYIGVKIQEEKDNGEKRSFQEFVIEALLIQFKDKLEVRGINITFVSLQLQSFY